MPERLDVVSVYAAGVEGAIPMVGLSPLPEGAERADYYPHTAGGVPIISDTPYVAPSYAERMQCNGTRTNGERCKGKARDGGTCCTSHADQE